MPRGSKKHQTISNNLDKQLAKGIISEETKQKAIVLLSPIHPSKQDWLMQTCSGSSN
jgi:hypothetical protein